MIFFFAVWNLYHSASLLRLGLCDVRCMSTASELVQRLHGRGVKVFLVSGGFHCLIRPVAEALNIPAENITANKLLFDFYGTCRHFRVNKLLF